MQAIFGRRLDSGPCHHQRTATAMHRSVRKAARAQRNPLDTASSFRHRASQDVLQTAILQGIRQLRFRSWEVTSLEPHPALLWCLLFRSSWLTVEGGRKVSAARVPHRRGGRAAVAVSVGAAGGVPTRKPRLHVDGLAQSRAHAAVWGYRRDRSSSSRAVITAPTFGTLAFMLGSLTMLR